MAHQLHAYAHDPSAPSYGMEAAELLGVAPQRVFKTLLAQTELPRDHGLVVAVVPVHRQLDLKALAAVVGAKKATMARPEDAERASGYVVGGISPIGQKRPMRTIIDRSALEHETVLVSGGRRGLDIELRPTDLATITDADVADIARD